MSIDSEDLKMLRTLVDACKDSNCADADDFSRRLSDLYGELTPETASWLLDEIDHLKASRLEARELRDKAGDRADRSDRENEALRKLLEDCSDSLHSEMLTKFGGQLPDDMHPVTRREYDRDMAELCVYRSALAKESGQ
ncbi:hypothetical protein CCL11_25785 [Pseudomonas syringae]|uniref:hypothetical protein n=1 Tax=Pseudomonas syringae TaxID=317 RepID=UPI000BB6406F|nr:hypothetical protein [Pseudomonas syringae]PBP34599.1 hypothetical protein CCL11_25785 [Pseudomonas syringae]